MCAAMVSASFCVRSGSIIASSPSTDQGLGFHRLTSVVKEFYQGILAVTALPAARPHR
jgi:hypothetical protein